QQYAHFQAGPRALGERLGQTLAQYAFRPEERLEVNGDLRRADFLEHGLEVSAVLENIDAVPVDRRAEREAGERRRQFVDRRVTLDVQVRIAVALDRPDEEQLNDEYGTDEGDNA